MKILVTGGLGFIGSNFIIKLLQKENDFEIINIDAKLFGSNPYNLDEIKNSEKYEFVKGNITNKNLMTELISKCDSVVNFAAETFVDRSIKDANPFLVSNIRGAFTLMDITTKQNKRFVQISTDEVFGSLESTTATEDSKFNPSSPYAATKAAAELLANSDWIFVEDHCEAVLASLLKGKSGQSYNIAADNEIDNISIVTKILEIMNKSQDLIEFVEDRPGHDQRYSMNSAKISKELDWKMQTKFEDGLEKTISWYMENPQIWKNLDSNIFESTPWKVSN